MRNWFAGRVDYAAFMNRVYRTRGTEWHGVPLWANGEAGFAAYVSGPLHTVQLLTVLDDCAQRATVYLDPDVFALFELPPQLR